MRRIAAIAAHSGHLVHVLASEARIAAAMAAIAAIAAEPADADALADAEAFDARTEGLDDANDLRGRECADAG
jgi:hypothetical protein